MLKKKVTYNPFESGFVSKAVPSTEAQREIWASIAMDSNATLCYNESLSINLDGSINTETFNIAFQELLKKHDSLRAAFSADGKTLFVKDYKEEPILFLDYSEKNKSDLEKLKKAEVQFKYDLVKGPCYRATLVKTGSKTYVFLLSAHHIVCDGWSFAILLNELSDFYNAISKHQIILGEEAFQFADFAINEYKLGLDQEHKSYWLKEFAAPLEINPFPIDYQRPAFRTFNSSRFDFLVPNETVVQVKKLGAREGCSFYSTLMSLLNVFVYNLSHSEDIVIGMASASQSGLGKIDLIGHLVNLLPLRTNLKNDLPFNLFMKLVRSKMLDAFDHQYYSYGAIVKNLKNINRDPAQLPLLNIVFNIDQQAPDQGLRFNDIKTSYNTIPRDYENFEIFINAISSGENLVLECQYNTNLFTAATIENWMVSFVALMNIIVKDSMKGVKSYVIPGLKIPKAVVAETKKSDISFSRNFQVEAKVKAIWSQVLLNNSLTVEDNFFEIGGHSLIAIEVASLLESEFKTSISVKDIFENPTIISLSNKIGSWTLETRETTLGISSSGLSSLSVSHNQFQVWYLEEMHPKTLMHNLPASIRIKTKIDRDILEKTLHIFIERHPSLRTSILVEDGVPVQKILDVSLQRFKPRLETFKTSEDKILEILNLEAQYVFNKSEPPLYKAKLFELGKNDYVFFFMVHHAIWDGWSFDIFFEELNIIYSALIKKETPRFIKNPEFTYADYSAWMNNLIIEKNLNKQLIFWENKLSGPLPILDLPLDFKRPVTMSHVGSTFHFTLPTDKVAMIREYAKSNKSSLFNVLLTAYKITLARYSGLDDIIVGLPVRGRSKPEIMQTIGYFVNTVALRSNVFLNHSFEENLKNVSKTCIDAFDNQLIPFQMILSKVNYSRDSSRSPIFQTFFSYQDISNRSAEINGSPYTQINIDKASTHTDLDLWIKASDEKIEGAFEYRTDLFKAVSIERFYECFFHILEGLTLNATKALNQLSSIPTRQLDLILKDWNDTNVELNNYIPFHKIFEKNAQANPHAIAVETAYTKITFGELDILSNRCANALLDQGVGRGDLVGISLSRNINLIASILGVLKTGAGYVPLDPVFPQDRLDYMLISSTPKILITEESLTDRFRSTEHKILISNIINDNRFDKILPTIVHALSDTIYVIFTSGSTGNPKGVQLTHGSVSNFLLSMNEKIGFDSFDKLLAVTTLSFDIAVLELFLPLISGGTIYLATGAEAMNGVSLKNIIEQKNISIMQATPSTWRLLLSSGWRGDKKIKVLCGGEAFPLDLSKSLIPLSGSVWNMYGPTETTVWSSCKKLSLEDQFITIGRPIANTSLYILDENRFMKPIGAIGELFIGGQGLALGYFGRNDLTIERFLPDPFIPGKKIYATGDLARFTTNGEVECLGRNDGQVKVRGYRIELGEIEAELQRIPRIREAAVITSEYRPGDVRITAFLSIENGEVLEERMLRDILSKKLPSYMIPSHFSYLQVIPKTLNGKIDKKSLKSLLIQGPAVSSLETKALKIPESNTQEILRLIWKDVLGVSELKDDDNFFNIGGNSMLAVELFSKIYLKFKINFPLSVLIETENFKIFSQKLESNLPILNSEINSAPVANAISIIPQIYKSMVAIKSTGNKNPFFCFHGVGGNILNYVTLAPATKNERPLYALQSIGLDGITHPLRSIEEMASNYIREIKLAQPEGPYLFAGGSMGGMIALEVAIQLTKRGDAIEKLIMFDTFGPNLDLKSYSNELDRPFLSKIKNALSYRSKIIVNIVQSRIYRGLGLPVPMAILLVEIERKNFEAIWKYFPKEQYNGELHLVRSTLKPTGWYSDPVMGWKGVIRGEIKTFEIDSTHENFIESPELVAVLTKLI
ncbi:MAG: amino acid adenylation domain-containing protein [Bacteriovorax sp.]|nr:amino acid adenylation domain-containing protein [Bacteriovorax sp.]